MHKLEEHQKHDKTKSKQQNFRISVDIHHKNHIGGKLGRKLEKFCRITHTPIRTTNMAIERARRAESNDTKIRLGDRL